MDKESLNSLIINNINNINNNNICYINYGKIISNKIFNLKIDNYFFKKNENNENNDNIVMINSDINDKFNIIPLVNSVLNKQIQNINIFEVTKYYYENKIHIIKKLNNGDSYFLKKLNKYQTRFSENLTKLNNNKNNNEIINNEIKYTIINKLNNFYLINSSEVDKCIKFNNIEKINNLYFPSLKEYNYIETYILVEWIITNDIKLQIKFYKKYINISIKINLIEKTKIPINKLNIIYKLYNDLDLIIKNYFI